MAQLVRDVMSKDPMTFGSDATVRQAAQAMRDRDIGDVLVVDGDEVRGIVTDRDIVVRGLADRDDLSGCRLQDVCNEGLVTAGPDEDADVAIARMRDNAVRRIPVVDGGRAVGVMSPGDAAIEKDERSGPTLAPPETTSDHTAAGFHRHLIGNRLFMDSAITVGVDGAVQRLTVDTRSTLLDALRDRLGNTSPKKGCDHGQCGACTVLLGGRRVLSCLTLAVAVDGAEVVTAAGLVSGADPHPVQQAFVEHDAFQCGFCTPGQICSAVGVVDELAAGWPSHVTADVAAEPEPTRAEIAERMAGNLCRCGAYANIVPAVVQAAQNMDRR